MTLPDFTKWFDNTPGGAKDEKACRESYRKQIIEIYKESAEGGLTVQFEDELAREHEEEKAMMDAGDEFRRNLNAQFPQENVSALLAALAGVNRLLLRLKWDFVF